MLIERARERVLAVALDMARQGLVRGTSGNISMRDPETGLVAVTPTGVAYEKCSLEAICVVDLTGKLVEGIYKPSSETPMHTAVYRARPDIHGVVHSHSVYATAFAVLNRELPVITIPMTLAGTVPVVPFEMPGSQELGDAVVRALGADGVAVLLQNHGPLCVAADPEKALSLAAYVEEGAQIALLALMAGGLNPIPPEKVELMRRAQQGGKSV